MNDWDGDTVLYPPQPPDVNTPWFKAKSSADPTPVEDNVEHSEEYLRGYRDGIARGWQEAFHEIDHTRYSYPHGGIELDGRQGMG